MKTPRFTPLVADLPATVPFVGPEAHMRANGRPFKARIGANESGFGPSPKAIEAMCAAAPEAWMYGDSECHDLREALAAYHGVTPAHIIIGEGIDGLLGMLVRMLVAPGDPVVTSDGAYPTFNYHVAGFGGVLHKVPYRDDHEDPGALLALAEEVHAKLLYFCNPDNPMGTWHSARVVERMVRAVPDGTLMVLDEAYIDAAPPCTAPQIDPDDPRVIRMRTFSKLFGLAGLRVGYAIGAPRLIAMFDRIRNHFGMGRVAQAGALAALADQAWLADIQARVSAARNQIAQIAAVNGLYAIPSATSFVALDTGRDGEFAKGLVDGLMARDVFVRMPFVAPQNRCIRVSAAPDNELVELSAALPEVLAQLSDSP
ncbi:MAG: pyridoxal phosphate-dependent aminotransferase [Alphaproteobacteria bacterium]|nr:pyridoxal phosphate-dependent aminotransferase [Alphaproteobacteria bacterium]